jgi:xanthine dehydrogenase accessory factor
MYDKSEIYQKLINAKKTGKTCVLATVIAVKGSSSARIGDLAIVENGVINGWVGGGCSQGVVKKVAAQLLERKAQNAKIIRVCPEDEFVPSVECYPSTCPSEGSVDLLLETIANDPIVFLYGETPIAQSVARYVENLSYHLDWTKKAGNLDDKAPLNSSSKPQAKIAVIATQGQGDINALLHSLSQYVDHVLVICSEKKSVALLQKLKEKGINNTLLNRVITHAGLDIGACTPTEVALAVMAQAVSLIRKNNEKIIEKSIAKVTVSKEPKLVEGVPVKSSCCG